MSISEWLWFREHRNDCPVDEWEGVTLAPHVTLAGLYAHRGDLARKLEAIDAEIERVKAKL